MSDRRRVDGETADVPADAREGQDPVVAPRQQEQIRDFLSRLDGRSPRVVLADGADERAVAAADWLAAHTSVRPVLIRAAGGGADASSSMTDSPGVETWDIDVLAADPVVLAALRSRPDGATRAEHEVATMAADAVYLAAAQVSAGRAAACVAGATRATSDVLRAALKVIGLAPGASTVSSSFLMVFPDGRRMAYGDCAVLPTPDERQLAQIALDTARTFQELAGEKPVVAMLSFSTMGSAQHQEVDLVRAATAIARELDPALCIDGELQFDAATVEAVGRSKAPGSEVAGRANVLIFPTLSAGNIGYKMAERLGGAAAFGPILQGLAAPMNDLSRGCSTSDIVSVALLSAVQSLRAGETRGQAQR
jgi:phosphotransacetylase